ncbi:DNA/RNA nuclease SfsA [Methanobrevibacter filiformis]|uniref:Sugar fermentation stimulation protein homolog n=1 Tax=Methanobrevibacter filiformis TaxID=55758 RepID=A0A166C4Y3_9EURY|nr:DNA/RNA nuclease SfsA [Methanobrevibacter filiformis]KZX11257.1 sugar fermentation stimulation protein A [Methanobrevibacter filiformis]
MSNYIKAIFKNRPNRFIANVEINGEEVIAHVPNTGRCKELLVPDTVVYLLPSDNPKRKTKYSLHFVENRGELVCIYSQIANKIVFEAIEAKQVKELSYYTECSREKTAGKSRIDIYCSLNNEDDGFEECYVEVKGVTLVEGKIAKFPDAPTERGRKHLKELILLKKQGIRTVVFFLVQHPLGDSFEPNWKNDPDFGEMLVKAYDAGVEILVYKTLNSLDGIEFVGESLDFRL